MVFSTASLICTQIMAFILISKSTISNQIEREMYTLDFHIEPYSNGKCIHLTCHFCNDAAVHQNSADQILFTWPF